MTVNLDNLICFAAGAGGGVGTPPGNTRKMWHYATNDLLSVVDDSAYFDDAVDVGLGNGDLIFVSGDLDGTPATNIYMVNSVTGATPVTTQGLSTVTLTYLNKMILKTNVTLTDGDSGHVVAPFAGTISKIYGVLTGGAVATNDAVVTGKIGSTSITNGAFTVAYSGSAIGDVDSCTPSALNVVAAGDVIKFAVSGTPGGSRTEQVTILLDA